MLRRVGAQVGALGEVVAQQAVHVLVRAALPWQAPQPGELPERRQVDANFFGDYLGNDRNDVRYMVAGPPGCNKQQQVS
jgi:hypothetical protein